jgi:phosphoenolpyruvate carboxylase
MITCNGEGYPPLHLGKANIAHIASTSVRTTSTLRGARLTTGQSTRLQPTAALARSIQHRVPCSDPQSHLQVELIRCFRVPGAGDDLECVQRGIHLSINGIAAGLRNTG